ncbi:MAG: GAF domain-containing protein [Eubacterium sp.]|nr:GAF domain-containing protein [Eubacterium sp.]
MDYDLIIRQMEALAEISSDYIPVMANVAALLYHSMEDINWVGFYLVKGDVLILGPFQGKTACVKIEKGRGVCGTAWEEDRTLLVPDVHDFPGHIACDSESRSEIVIPIHGDREVFAVLDIDSPVPARFSEPDMRGLLDLVVSMEKIITITLS